MSRRRTTYSIEFKTKLVLEVLRNEDTFNETASKNDIIPKTLQQAVWAAQKNDYNLESIRQRSCRKKAEDKYANFINILTQEA